MTFCGFWIIWSGWTELTASLGLTSSSKQARERTAIPPPPRGLYLFIYMSVSGLSLHEMDAEYQRDDGAYSTLHSGDEYGDDDDDEEEEGFHDARDAEEDEDEDGGDGSDDDDDVWREEELGGVGAGAARSRTIILEARRAALLLSRADASHLYIRRSPMLDRETASAAHRLVTQRVTAAPLLACGRWLLLLVLARCCSAADRRRCPSQACGSCCCSRTPRSASRSA